jgi:hypothetical protein
MANNFAELRDRMNPDARARSEAKAAAMLVEMASLEDQSASLSAGGSPASSPESNPSSPTASQD